MRKLIYEQHYTETSIASFAFLTKTTDFRIYL